MFKYSVFLYFIVNALSALKSASCFTRQFKFYNHGQFDCCIENLRDAKIVIDCILDDLYKKDGDFNEFQDKN